MTNRSLYSLLGIALCVGAALTGCSGDDDESGPASPKTSGEGQSCQSSADCSSSLVCVNLTCEKADNTHPNAGNDGSGGSTGGGAAKGGSGGTGAGRAGTGNATGGTTVAPVLGGEGESCTKRADCEADLRCFNQRCTASEETGGGAGAGGQGTTAPPPAPRLGQIGETCVLSSDCDTGLTCLPGSNAGQEGVGVCSISHTGITPTGKSCVGECSSAADCCELPITLLSTLGVASCADLAAKIGSVDCATDPSGAPADCFAQATYCECDKTWACTASECVYKPDCSNDGLTTEGCPTYTRSGRVLPSTCTDKKCEAATVPDCTTDDDCETTAVADDIGDTCSKDECTCYQATGKCYRKCDSDLDCAFGFSCDTKKTHVCTAVEECADDVYCQKLRQDVSAVCNAGKCAIGCNSDLDCNQSLIAFTQVCDATTHVCEDPGCRSDGDCFGAGIHMFCIDTPEQSSVGGVASAITD